MNWREQIRDVLAAYGAAHADQASVAQRIDTLVATCDDCLRRTGRPGHLTASAWVVSADGERHLLMHHRKLGKWLQPGGHADGDPDLVAVARREVAEETGLADLELVRGANGLAPLDLDVHLIPARESPDGALIEDAHEHHDVRYLFRVMGDESLTANEESHAVRWCSADEVSALTSEPSVLRLLDKARQRL